MKLKLTLKALPKKPTKWQLFRMWFKHKVLGKSKFTIHSGGKKDENSLLSKI